MPGLSRETKLLNATGECPLCNANLNTGKFTDPHNINVLNKHFEVIDNNWTRAFALTFPYLPYVFDKSKIYFLQCRVCNGIWPLLAGSSMPSLIGDSQLFIDEFERSDEPRGTEERVIDNSSSVAGSTRRLSAKREDIKTFTWENSEEFTLKSEAGLGKKGVATFKASAEAKIRSAYAFTSEEKLSWEEEIIIEIPAKTRARLLLHWKRIWQHAVTRISFPDGSETRKPFRVTVGLTFDQELIT
jgi:hypothetical protein